MSLFDGMAPPVLRKDGGLVSSPRRAGISIFGTIQPEVLKGFWSEVTDPDGYWSRFLYCYLPKSLKSLPKTRTGKVNKLPVLLSSLYKTIHDLPAATYKLDDDAYQTYAVFYDFIARKAYSEVHPAKAKSYSKALGMTGRLILNLHILNEVMTNKSHTPSEVIKTEGVIKGIDLMQFYLQQRELLMNKYCPSDTISPELLAIFEASKRAGSVTAREIKQYVWHLKSADSNTIRSWFQELESLGYGVTEGKGSRLKFKAHNLKSS